MPADIIPFLNGHAFEPAQVEALGQAFDRAAKCLHDKGQPDVVREVIAKRIIEIGKTGERDPDRICALALQALGLPPDGARP